jgi:peptidyl-prolyl cis-trans isomerase B (cyclophilin B)
MSEPTPAPKATMETDHGTIELEFWPDVAPKTVENFLKLARDGFYNGLIFHRVIPGFMIQGGCPQGTGTGGPGYQIKAEFSARKHKRGVISMARSSHPDSAGSQFFLMHDDSPHLDGKYTAFGQITKGIEVVDKIAALPCGSNDRPKQPPKIVKITVHA